MVEAETKTVVINWDEITDYSVRRRKGLAKSPCEPARSVAKRHL
jgi:hypothetical protein